jgi:isocitrate/isopropylmalate dehydrogenase
MTHRLAVIPGDGTGPEVVAEGLKVLNAIAGPAGLKFDYTITTWAANATSNRRSVAGFGVG